MPAQPPFLCVLCLSLAAPGAHATRHDFASRDHHTTVVPAQRDRGRACRDAGAKARADAPAPDALVERARRGDTVRVIVTLAVAFTPEGELPNARAVRRQRRAIAAAQERLLRRLRGRRIAPVKRFETVPSLALTADAAALACVRAAPEVARVEEDLMVAPASRD